MKKYILLRGLVEGNCFFSTNVAGDDPTRLHDGTLAYEVLGYADTVKEAQIALYGRSYTTSND